MNRQAPLTKAAMGSTRCPYCEKRFADTPGNPTVDIEGDEAYTRKGSVSMGETRRTTRRWHTDCLSEFEAANEAYRRQVAADQEQMIRDLCEAAGLDYDTVKAKHDRRQAERVE